MRTGNIKRDMKEAQTNSLDYHEAAVALFGIPREHASNLFSPGRSSPADGQSCQSDSTPKQVAKWIRTYAKWWAIRARQEQADLEAAHS